MATRLTRIAVAGSAGLALVAAAVGSAGTASAGPVHPASAGLTVVAVRHSLLGTHTWYRQTYGGVPVLGGWYAVHVADRTGARTVDDGRIAVTGAPDLTPSVAATGAGGLAAARSGGAARRSTRVVVPGSGVATARLAWEVLSDRADGSVRTVVDAHDGAVLSSAPVVKEATGTGTVFDPSPVVTLQNEDLKDRGDRDTAALAGAYQRVTLTHLDSKGGLNGDYATNVSKDPVTSPTGTFTYTRADRGFEQVMGYYHLTSAQEYIHRLGFTDVNNEPQDYRTTGFSGDNSFYDPSNDKITYGTGGVDDAEDAEVIWHEYGHAIQDAQVPGFGSTEEAGAIGEGFGDYWAMTMSSPVNPDTATTPLACIADWDSVSYTTGTPHCLRRTDGTKVYPTDLDGEVHDDGEIWSRALYDIFRSLGRTKADTAILEAQFSFAPGIAMPSAAIRIVTAARTLYGDKAANACQAAFAARHIL